MERRLRPGRAQGATWSASVVCPNLEEAAPPPLTVGRVRERSKRRTDPAALRRHHYARRYLPAGEVIGSVAGDEHEVPAHARPAHGGDRLLMLRLVDAVTADLMLNVDHERTVDVRRGWGGCPLAFQARTGMPSAHAHECPRATSSAHSTNADRGVHDCPGKVAPAPRRDPVSASYDPTSLEGSIPSIQTRMASLSRSSRLRTSRRSVRYRTSIDVIWAPRLVRSNASSSSIPSNFPLSQGTSNRSRLGSSGSSCNARDISSKSGGIG
jgi:hypothetical protein